MSRHTKNKRKKSSVNKIDVFLKSRRVFSKAYEQTNDVSVLTAQFSLEQYVEKGDITVQEAWNILNSPDLIKACLDQAEGKYKEGEQKKITGVLEKLADNTSAMKTLGIALAANALFFLVSSISSPFFSAWLQPTADEIFKRSPKTQKPVVPQIAPSKDPSLDTVEIKNYFFQIPFFPQENFPKHKHPRCENV